MAEHKWKSINPWTAKCTECRKEVDSRSLETGPCVPINGDNLGEQHAIHLKSGKPYVVMSMAARLEFDGETGPLYAVYRSDETGQVWIRPLDEFTRRFRLVSL